MPYKQSVARRRWTDERLARIDVLATAHASVGRVTGPGRPLRSSKPVAHAYIIGMLAEFQGFARDLHDQSIRILVAASGAGQAYRSILIDGMTTSRGIDRGNATTSTLRSDFARLGLRPFDPGTHNARWSTGDSADFDKLMRLRNVLGHGDEAGLRALIKSGAVQDTVTWARQRRPLLNRYVGALDHLVWNHLVQTVGKDPWA